MSRFKVIVPAIIQLIVANQKLPIYNGALELISPNMVRVSLNTSLKTPLPVTIDNLPLYLYNKNTTPFTPFINLTLLKQRISGNTPAIITNQTVKINNDSELVSWFNTVFDHETAELSVKAYPSVHLGELQSNHHLDKTLDLPALNYLSGMSIRDLMLVLPPVNGNNLKGSLNLPNWGFLDLGLGNITLNLLSGDVRLGIVHINDVYLQRGNNTKDFEGQLFLNALVPNLGAILASQLAPLGRGVIELNATGNSTIVNGEHIKFVESILNNKKLTLDISIITLLSDVLIGFLGTGSSASLVDSLGDVFGNSTFVQSIVDHWNTTSVRNMTNDAARLHMKRAARRGNVMWNFVRLGMKVKQAKA